MTARRVAIAVLVALSSVVLAAAEAPRAGPRLYQQFRDPPKQFGLMPYWFWNGRITAEETRRQIRLMIEQGVHAAIVFPWDGLEVPYLSEAWWQALGDALDAAQELGFTLNLNDEFTWPSGHAWDHYQQGAELSRVLAARPDYRMKTLAVETFALKGPKQWHHVLNRPAEVIVAGRPGSDGNMEPDTLRLIEPEDTSVAWAVPAGRWKVFVYTPREVTGAHNARVDPLNAAATRKYLDLVYEPLARRFPQHLGRTLRLTSADHEGTMGVHPVSTPKLWETFQARHGYDLRPLLPLLEQKGGGRGLKVRSDYFDTVSELFRSAFVEQVTQWCAAHGLQHAASFYEEQLGIQVARAGDMLAIWRTTSAVEIDALLERARMPIDFKEAVSVAHFDRKKLVVENQGLQGHASFLSPEKMRLGSNMALLWGADVLVPYFEYDPSKVQWPPQWFLGQPYRPYFHHYSDTVRRVSFLNSRGRHVAPIVLYYPLESAWAHSESRFVPGHRELDWDNIMDEIQAYYTALELRLARGGWDYHVMDAHYLQRATVEAGSLHLADETFRVVILPPLTTVSQPAMRKLGRFFDDGGVVLAIGRLPTSSPEAGADDPVIGNRVKHLFGDDALRGHTGVRRSAGGGVACFFPCGHHPNFMNVLDYTTQLHVPPEYRYDLAPVLETLARYVPRTIKVVRGASEGIYASHRVDADTDLYWVVNDSDRPREITIRVGASGFAQGWDPETGDRHLLSSRAAERGTEVDLRLEPWGGTYVVMTPSADGLSPQRPAETVKTMDLTGHRWRFTPESAEVYVPYARVRRSAAGEGERRGWHGPTVEPAGWTDAWLAVERSAQPSWWLIGPFPYGDHEGYNHVFPPEQEVRLDARYPGERRTQVGWVYKTSPTDSVNVRALLAIPSPANSVVYAYSDVYAPNERQGQIRVAFADSIKLWWNGQEKIAVHRHPKWMLLRDPWSEHAAITIRQGWNRVLLKVCRSENRPISFLFRIADPAGNTLTDLRYAKARDAVPPPGPTEGETWYRVQAPPGTRAVEVPGFETLRRVYINGDKGDGNPGRRIELPTGGPATIAFCCGPTEQLERPIRFVSGTTETALGSWTGTSLAHYSGRARYETEFDLPAPAPDETVELDCGAVGVTAEVWINGAKAGERVWRPYRFDITAYVHGGRNAIKVIVADSDANWQAQGDPIYPVGSWGLNIRSERERLASLDPSGLLGPVTICVQRRRPVRP